MWRVLKEVVSGYLINSVRREKVGPGENATGGDNDPQRNHLGDTLICRGPRPLLTTIVNRSAL